jgi:hypothetical protein
LVEFQRYSLQKVTHIFFGIECKNKSSLLAQAIMVLVKAGSYGYQAESSVARGGDDCAEKASRRDRTGLTLHTVTWTDDARCM